MIVPDVNMLVYAYNETSPLHHVAKVGQSSEPGLKGFEGLKDWG